MTFRPVPFLLHSTSRHGLLVFWKSSRITTKSNCVSVHPRERETRSVDESGGPPGRQVALCPGRTQAGAAGLVRVRPRKLSCHWPERRGRQPIRSASVSTLLGWRRPRKFEMADGLLAAGELGPEAMGPGPERTGWAAEEAGECPPGRPGEPPAARGLRRPGRRGPGGGGGCASPRRQSREASRATPVLPAPSDPGVLGSGGRWTRRGVPAPGVRPQGLPGLVVPLRLRGQRRW